MQTDLYEDLELAHKEYVAALAAKGFTFKKYDPTAPLPSWVLRNGERPKTEFVTRSQTSAPPPAKSVQPVAKPTEPVTVTVAAKPAAGQSFAAQVRAVIADVKPKGWTQEQVVEHAVSVLMMKRTSAINCVKHNWNRA